ncbi:MAG: tetratricopeptide repeat protein [Aestuariivirga sp.]|nr:tetratricopeptide repeat protein [Aestuariivirga sp.]
MAKSPTRRDLENLDRAQELIYDAWDAKSSAKREALAKTALDISGLCADAYLVLADGQRRGSQRRTELICAARDAGRAALGEKLFAELTGEFWLHLETRPYMRACHYLVIDLQERSELSAASVLMHEMLILNPNDNQGIRYLLCDALIAQGKNEEARRLLTDYKGDVSANFQWNTVLLSFRKGGNSTKTLAALKNALKQNGFVPWYLTGRSKIPKKMSNLLELGGKSEAASYAQYAIANWTNTPGAIDWLRMEIDARADR